jgi:hypothetical protein
MRNYFVTVAFLFDFSFVLFVPQEMVSGVNPHLCILAQACSVGWWLMAGAGLF